MKRILTTTISLVLAILMVTLVPLQTFAATKVEYIKEIRIGYGEAGKQKLIDEGYTVWKDKSDKYLNANEGGTGNAVYLGYKLTDKKEDAITDLAVMPMSYSDGAAYSFDVYQKEMENLNAQIDKMLADFDAAIAEFRANLAKPAPANDYALRAYTMLNMYVEDDTNQPVGKLFANGEFNDAGTFAPYETEPNTQAYHNILMMGNSTAVYAIKLALAIGCTETDGTTFLDRLTEAEYPDEIPASMNSSITTIANCMDSFQKELALAQSTRNRADEYEGGRAAYLTALGETDPNAVATAVSQMNLIDTMAGIDYGDVTDADGKSYTFLDVMNFSTDAASTNLLKLDANLLSVLVSVMTPGQISIAQYVGLPLLINNASSTKLEKVNGHYALGSADASLEQLEQLESISVYLGVDRTIFSDGDYKTVAITDAAIREGINNENFGVTADYNDSSNNIAKVALGVSAGVCAAAAIGCIAYAAVKWGSKAATQNLKFTAKVFFDGEKTSITDTYSAITSFLEKNKDTCTLRGEIMPLDGMPASEPTVLVTSTGTKITAVAGVIFAAAAIALAIVTFVQSIKEPEREKVDYTDIPRAIIDVKREANGQSQYFAYYAARLAGASDDYQNEKDTTKLYGDLNGLNGYEKWLCLYYARLTPSWK